MSTKHLVDPELLPGLEMIPRLDLTAESLPMIRAAMEQPHIPQPPPLIEPEIVAAPGRDGAPDVTLFVYRPPGNTTGRPALLHIHGGGMVIGTAAMSKASMPRLALAFDAVVVSVEYRLAPETPFPGPQEDCYAGLDWLISHADALGVDTGRIIVTGESAGGGLAAALALMVRDRGEYSLLGQLLIYPMLDHRTGGPDCRYRNPTTGEFIWAASQNSFGWESLRGNYAPSDARRGWFSPALEDSLAGLPQTFISVGSLDLFFDEDLDYTRRLCAAGVPVELHVYPGAYHGFNIVQDAAIAKQADRDLVTGLGRMLGLSPKAV
jgi:acetyl esterase